MRVTKEMRKSGEALVGMKRRGSQLGHLVSLDSTFQSSHQGDAVRRIEGAICPLASSYLPPETEHVEGASPRLDDVTGGKLPVLPNVREMSPRRKCCTEKGVDLDLLHRGDDTNECGIDSQSILRGRVDCFKTLLLSADDVDEILWSQLALRHSP